jgi:hypothetical protein
MDEDYMRDFMDRVGVTGLIIGQICSGCDEEKCAGCDGVSVMRDLEEQIFYDGIEYMKSIAMQFGEPSDAGGSSD